MIEIRCVLLSDDTLIASDATDHGTLTLSMRENDLEKGNIIIGRDEAELLILHLQNQLNL